MSATFIFDGVHPIAPVTDVEAGLRLLRELEGATAGRFSVGVIDKPGASFAAMQRIARKIESREVTA